MALLTGFENTWGTFGVTHNRRLSTPGLAILLGTTFLVGSSATMAFAW
jgi:hypothetical protein